MNNLIFSCFFCLSIIQSLTLFGQSKKNKEYEDYFENGKNLYKSGNYLQAIDAYSKTLMAKPEFLDAYLERAKAYEAIDSNKLAIDDLLSYSGKLSKTDYQSHYNLARLYNKINNYKDAIVHATTAINEKNNYLPAYKEKIDAYIAIENYNDALKTSQSALDIKKCDTNYFTVGKVYFLLKSYESALSNLDNAIKKNYNYEDAYIYKAMTLIELGEPENLNAAYQAINLAINRNKYCRECLLVRSKILHDQNNIIPAINDLNTVINRDPDAEDIDKIIFTRGIYHKECLQHIIGIDDFNEVLKMNPDFIEAYYQRGLLYNEIDKKQNAVDDFESYLYNSKDNSNADPIILQACTDSIYALKREKISPVIIIYEPIQRLEYTLDINKSREEFKIKGKIKDDNEIRSLTINGSELNIDNELMKDKWEFESDYIDASLEEIIIEVTDVYNNTCNNTFKIRRTENDPPIINMLRPYSDGDNLYIEGDPPTIMLEGNVNDESLIKSFKLDSISNICYDPIEPNPLWWGGIEISNRNSITLSVEDYFGNVTIKSYNIIRNMTALGENNPMGNTWALLFANSNYKYYEPLDGPKVDAMQIQKTLKNDYNFQNVIIQNDLSKNDFEKYFQVDLRRIIEYYDINSLLIWYAGHGLYQNDESYWLPVDAQNNMVTSYFSTTALKSYLVPYANDLAHLLIVSDACNSGSSFYELYRESPQNLSCNNANLMTKKSYQVLTSSKSDQVSSDQSKFVQIFLDVLNNEKTSCISVDKIYEELKNEFNKQSIQTPQLGAIKGMSDQNGTFFFIKQVKSDQ